MTHEQKDAKNNIKITNFTTISASETNDDSKATSI